MAIKKKNCVFLDRDGVINIDKGYISKISNFEMYPGIGRAINFINKKKYLVIIVTNQSGVGRGYFEIGDVIDCNNKMIELIGLGQNVFQEICIAPDYPPKEKTYRKPSSLFANELIKKYDLDKKSIVYIGDSISDLKTARNTGCDAYGVMSGGYDLETLIKSETDLKYDIFPNLLEVVNHLIDNKKI